MHKPLSAAIVSGVRIDLIDRDSLLGKLMPRLFSRVAASDLGVIHTINPEICMCAWRNSEYVETLNAGTYNIVDGVGLQWALQRFTHQRVQRTCGSDLIFDLADMARQASRTLLLFGGNPSRLQKACRQMEQRFPGLRVGGYSPPYAPGLPLPNPTEVERMLIESRPGVLAVCLGAPRQEIWIQANKDLLQRHDVRIAVGLGGTVDFLSGEIPRAPLMMRQMGLEWLYRLRIEPDRWKRQISTLPAFVARTVFDRSFIRHA